ncbi:MAG: hypothetical protein AVDCRST_MAG62-1842, partial [uncultured Sphingomonas sp.]
ALLSISRFPRRRRSVRHDAPRPDCRIACRLPSWVPDDDLGTGRARRIVPVRGGWPSADHARIDHRRARARLPAAADRRRRGQAAGRVRASPAASRDQRGLCQLHRADLPGRPLCGPGQRLRLVDASRVRRLQRDILGSLPLLQPAAHGLSRLETGGRRSRPLRSFRL